MTSPKISWSPSASSASQRSKSGWYSISTYELYHICASTHCQGETASWMCARCAPLADSQEPTRANGDPPGGRLARVSTRGADSDSPDHLTLDDYGSEGWGFESLRARCVSPGQGWFGTVPSRSGTSFVSQLPLCAMCATPPSDGSVIAIVTEGDRSVIRFWIRRRVARSLRH